MRDVMLYVHVPFCSSKCHFCSWVSPIPTAELVRAQPKFGLYAKAVVTEIRHSAEQLHSAGMQPKLIYFGGGTPSLLNGHDLAGILAELKSQFPATDAALDVTLEMSPDTATPEKLATLKAAGFNRINFGVQYFNERRARSLGRAHTPKIAIEAFSMARNAGFENINIDLMIGLPEEDETEYKGSVETAITLDPDHISIYLYKKSHGTVLAKLIDNGKLEPCPKSTAVERYEVVSEMLWCAGYTEYMFQLFGKRGKRCLVDYHYFNLSYDYLGFGQGAHSLISGRAYTHGQSLEEYLRAPRHSQSFRAIDSETLLETKAFEMMHTEEGLHYDRFAERLRVSFKDALRKSPRLRRVMDGVAATPSVEISETGVRIAGRQERIDWLTYPPHWKVANPQPSVNDLVRIAASA